MKKLLKQSIILTIFSFLLIISTLLAITPTVNASEFSHSTSTSKITNQSSNRGSADNPIQFSNATLPSPSLLEEKYVIEKQVFWDFLNKVTGIGLIHKATK